MARPSKANVILLSVFYRWGSRGSKTLQLVSALDPGLSDSQTVLFILPHAASGETLRRERDLHISKVDSRSVVLGPEKGGRPHIGPCAPGTSAWALLELVFVAPEPLRSVPSGFTSQTRGGAGAAKTK